MRNLLGRFVCSAHTTPPSQLHWCGMLDSLQSPKRDTIKVGQEGRVNRPCPRTHNSKVKGQWRNTWATVNRCTSQSEQGVVIWIPLFSRLSTVRRRSWKASHICSLASSGAWVFHIHLKQLLFSWWVFYKESWRRRDRFDWVSNVAHQVRWRCFLVGRG